jgi:hypothetical protein
VAGLTLCAIVGAGALAAGAFLAVASPSGEDAPQTRVVLGPPSDREGRASLEGRVVGREGQPVAGAIVRFEPFGLESTAGSEGQFFFGDLPVRAGGCERTHLIVSTQSDRAIVELFLLPGENATEVQLPGLDPRDPDERSRGRRPVPSCARSGP